MIAMLVLQGCQATTGSSERVMKQVADTTLASGWRVDCTENQATAVRRCFTGTFGEGATKAPFQVYFFNKDGPFVQAGFHTDPTASAVVGVDDGKPHFLTPFNRFMAEQTYKARKAEGVKLVADLKTGEVAHVQYSPFPHGPKTMPVRISGFAEAYGLLLKKVNE
jgi:hypothetical protein